MNRFVALAGSIVSFVVAASVPSATAAPISKSTRFQNSSGKVTCGVESHAPKVLCAARGIPAPNHKGAGKSGFVELGVLGPPQVLRLSHSSFAPGQLDKLGRGRLWNQVGVTCHVALITVLCFNGNNHGFVIGDGNYTSF